MPPITEKLSFLIGGSNSRLMGGTRGPFVWPMWAQAHLSVFSFWIIYCCTFPDEVTLLLEVTSYLGGTHVKLNESEMPLLTLGPRRVTNDGTIGRCIVVTGNPSVSINPDKCFYTSFAANSHLIYFVFPTCQATWTESTRGLQVVAINTQHLSSRVQRHKMESFGCTLQFNDRWPPAIYSL